MSEPTYSELQRRLTKSKKREDYLKERIGFWRTRARTDRQKLNNLVLQYERIIKEWRKMYLDVVENGWKLLFVKVYNKLQELKERSL